GLILSNQRPSAFCSIRVNPRSSALIRVQRALAVLPPKPKAGACDGTDGSGRLTVCGIEFRIETLAHGTNTYGARGNRPVGSGSAGPDQSVQPQRSAAAGSPGTRRRARPVLAQSRTLAGSRPRRIRNLPGPASEQVASRRSRAAQPGVGAQAQEHAQSIAPAAGAGPRTRRRATRSARRRRAEEVHAAGAGAR